MRRALHRRVDRLNAAAIAEKIRGMSEDECRRELASLLGITEAELPGLDQVLEAVRLVERDRSTLWPALTSHRRPKMMKESLMDETTQPH